MEIFSVILNIVVLGCLGVTIFYAYRLSKSLDAFKQTRQQFDAVMRELSRNIDEAYAAVDGLKRATKDTGASLQKTLSDSRVVARELEVLSDHGRKLINQMEILEEGLVGGFEDERPEPEVFEESFKDDNHTPAFTIFDRDIDDPAGEDEGDFPEEPAAPAAFQSQAERDLFEALMKTRKPGRG